jgi:hypothetical protein
VIVFFPGVSGDGRPAQAHPDLCFRSDNFNGTGLNGGGCQRLAAISAQRNGVEQG